MKRADVVVDARRMTWNPTSGTGVYAARLVSALAEQDRLSVRVVSKSGLVDLRHTARFPLARYLHWTGKLCSDLGEIPLATMRARLRHLLYPEGVALAPFLVTVHDLDEVLRGPGYPLSSRYYGWRVVATVKRARRVISPSLSTAREIRRVLGREEGVRVVHLGVDPPESALRPSADGAPYFLYSGGIARRKNLETLFRAWTVFAREFPGELLITGVPRLQGAHLPTGARLVGTVSREALWGLYAGALGVVYPSLCEGFGFPVVEAAVLGRPVVCGSVGIVPELPDSLVVRADVRNPQSILAGMREIAAGWLPDPVGIRWAREHFTWHRCAQETIAVYEECL